MVDASCGDLLDGGRQPGDGETGGVGARALIAAQRLRVDFVQIPHEQASSHDGVATVGGGSVGHLVGPRLTVVEQSGRRVDDCASRRFRRTATSSSIR
jgi:hypothetical protein